MTFIISFIIIGFKGFNEVLSVKPSVQGTDSQIKVSLSKHFFPQLLLLETSVIPDWIFADKKCCFWALSRNKACFLCQVFWQHFILAKEIQAAANIAKRRLKSVMKNRAIRACTRFRSDLFRSNWNRNSLTCCFCFSNLKSLSYL